MVRLDKAAAKIQARVLFVGSISKIMFEKGNVVMRLYIDSLALATPHRARGGIQTFYISPARSTLRRRCKQCSSGHVHTQISLPELLVVLIATPTRAPLRQTPLGKPMQEEKVNWQLYGMLAASSLFSTYPRIAFISLHGNNCAYGRSVRAWCKVSTRPYLTRPRYNIMLMFSPRKMSRHRR